MLLKTADAESAIICNKNGSVDLYHDNSKKFETTSYGSQVTGINYVTGNLGVGKQTPAQLGGDGGKLLHVAGADNPEIVLERTTSGTEAKASFRINDAEDLVFRVQDGSATAVDALTIQSNNGLVNIPGQLNVESNFDVIGNITVSGTVDGRDVAADGTKLDGIESGATADQSASEIVSLLSNQNIATTGTLGSGDFTLTGTAPKITFTDSNDNPDYLVQVNGGIFVIHDATNSADKFKINSDGHIDITPNTDFAAGIDVTGNITATGSLDLSSDSSEITIGAGNDLTLKADGSNSAIVHNGDGDMNILAQGSGEDIRLKANENVDIFVGTNETAIHCDKDGEVELYHNNVKKAETVSGGFTVTGTCTATSFAGDGSSLTGISAGATGGGSDEVFYENDQSVTTNYTITNGKNAMAAGPITINSGVTVTVGSGETLTIV